MALPTGEDVEVRTVSRGRSAVERPHAGRLRIGCSGFSYKTWRGVFYPQGMRPAAHLSFYATHFATVELNSTFYRLPEAETFVHWAEATPPSFVFAVKASRYLTHLTRLRDPEAPLARLFSRVAGLGRKLGPVLYQFPSRFERDLDRLGAFLRALPATLAAHGRRGVRLRHVVEFRHPSWYEGETFALLEHHGVSLCVHDKGGSEVSEPQVGPVTYARFHGTSGHYHGEYGAARLRPWAERLAGAWLAGREVYAYFNNDPDASATRDALTLERDVVARIADTRRPGATVLAGAPPGPVTIRGR